MSNRTMQSPVISVMHVRVAMLDDATWPSACPADLDVVDARLVYDVVDGFRDGLVVHPCVCSTSTLRILALSTI
jgi:hypothetical protein